jgi:hypothetical protein
MWITPLDWCATNLPERMQVPAAMAATSQVVAVAAVVAPTLADSALGGSGVQVLVVHIAS